MTAPSPRPEAPRAPEPLRIAARLDVAIQALTDARARLSALLPVDEDAAPPSRPSAEALAEEMARALQRLEHQAERCWLDQGYPDAGKEAEQDCGHDTFMDCVKALLDAIQGERALVARWRNHG